MVWRFARPYNLPRLDLVWAGKKFNFSFFFLVSTTDLEVNLFEV